MRIADIEDRARETAAAVVEHVNTIRYDPPPVPLSRALVALAVVAALGIGGAWWIKRERDAWWRDRIASSSATVRAIIKQGGAEAAATDDQILRGIEDAEAKRLAAERALDDEKSRKADPGRDVCRVPAHCLRAQ